MDGEEGIQSVSERFLSIKGNDDDDHNDADGAGSISTGSGVTSNGLDSSTSGGTGKDGTKNGGGAQTAAGSNNNNTQIAVKENRHVLFIRLVVLFVLVASTVAVATVVYLYIRRSELSEFHEQFESDAHKILSSLGDSFDLTMGALDAFVVSIVSYAASEVSKATAAKADSAAANGGAAASAGP